MSGALLQLAALSSQDVYLTANPEITLFKKTYMRYTNFSIETVQIAFDGSVSFGNETYANLEKTGDLISKIVLVVNLQQLTSTKKWGYVDKIGHAIIDSVSIYIGGAEIDSRNNDWIDIYQSITRDRSQKDNYNIMIGNVPTLKKLDCGSNQITHLDNLPPTLEILYCYWNKITQLDNLPQTLKKLYCSVNKITQIDNLPITLEILDCSDNQIAYLNNLPPTLIDLYCSGNQLTQLDNLPNGLIKLVCYNNKFKYNFKLTLQNIRNYNNKNNQNNHT